MPKAKKYLLLREKRETWRIRLNGTRRAFCKECGRTTTWLFISQAARHAGLSERAVFRLTEENAVHFVEVETGRLLICDPSLKKYEDTHRHE